MMNRQLISLVVPWLVVGSCILAKGAEAGGNNTDSEFAGKIVYVQMTTNEKFTLENVKVIGRGEESFLAGRGITKTDLAARHEWWEGLPVRLNLRLVASYFPLTPEQWKNLNDK